MDYYTARNLAERVVSQLTPYCEKIKICGSIRRHKAEVNDIDIVCLPKTEPVKDLFGMVTEHRRMNGFISAINAMEKVKGDPDGKYTQRLLEGVKVEIAMAHPDNYGNLVLIRTGNAAFSQWFMNEVLKRGYNQRDGFLYKRDQMISVPDEIVYFKTIGIPYVQPEKRNL
jgi:DNA polymerase/3'-5' exonuclease PolX